MRIVRNVQLLGASALALLALSGTARAQQWDGQATLEDPIWRGGQVGIGKYPIAKLDVLGDLAMNDFPVKLRGSLDASHYLKFSQARFGLVDVDFWSYTNYIVMVQGENMPRFTFPGAGSLGIGTMDPGDIADGARGVAQFFALATLLTALAVYWYCHSIKLTLLPVVCSLTSMVWQFGVLRILGYGLDPLAVLVPFLVFAIGVSHGVQQINFIVREIAAGNTTEQAARSSFRGLLIPGTLALVTAFVSFLTLILIPIPMVRELAITACIGVAFKIATNLVMLQISASLFEFSREYADKAMAKRLRRAGWLRALAGIAKPRNAMIVMAVTLILFGTAVWQSRERIIGTLEPGAPELRLDAGFNQDAISISESYAAGLDWLTVAFEAPSETSCENPAIGIFQDQFVAHMSEVPGVLSISSFSSLLRSYNEGYNEVNPKMNAIPTDPANYGGLAAEIGRLRGYVKKDRKEAFLREYLKAM